jgi:alpha-N-acetylglucosaminidase
LAMNPFARALQGTPNCVGMGLFPEAIENNPVYFDLAFDLIWRDKPVDLDVWLKDYARRRYGERSPAADEAWSLLNNTVYRQDAIHSSVFAARPALDLKMADPNTGIGMPYDPAKVLRAWELLLSDADRLKGSPGYRYDVVDLGRQVMADLAQPLHWKVANAFLDRNTDAFAAASQQFLDLYTDADTLCATEPVLSYRRWIRSAMAWAKTPEERALYTFNANMLITHWGSDFLPVIFDYSWHEWGGLIGDYYKGRWERFHAMLTKRIATGEPWTEAGLPMVFGKPKLDCNPFYAGLYDWELKWIRTEKDYDSETVGDPLVTAQAMLAKYRSLMDRSFSKEGRSVWAQQQQRVREDNLAIQHGKQAWKWAAPQPTNDWQDVAFDITSLLEVGSRFKLTFVRESGQELDIRQIVVEQDGAAISKDKHDGFTGRKGWDWSSNNTYHFTLPMVVPNAKYTVKAQILATAPDSSGQVWLGIVE